MTMERNGHRLVVSAGIGCLYLDCACGGLFVRMKDREDYMPIWEAHAVVPVELVTAALTGRLS